MTGKKAIHFGGGNIGRGFVAEFLHQAGYEVVFVDVVDALIDKLNATPTYTVTEVGEEGTKTTKVDNYRALNSKTHEADVISEIATADTVTCAVGPNILKFIAPVIAKGLNARKASTPAAVIACENAVMATNTLKEFIFKDLTDETKGKIDEVARFANSAVDRIVPHQDADAGMNVKIESFWEWCVELPPFKGMEEPKVSAIHYVEDLSPYIERKLFTVNTGHATTAYFAKLAGKEWIHEALADADIRSKVDATLKETAKLIVSKHGIAEDEQNAYVEKIIKRFSNKALLDKVDRVGRQPLRKLSRGERLVAPAAELAKDGYKPVALLATIEAAFRFQNVEGDEESVELAKILKENDAAAVVDKVTGLKESDALYKDVLEVVKKVQG
ncbi:mannitol-1-phosphate dehydrogenase [Microthyrium microscopicum]|uniref:Mannitol-1-phosphate 5-dehydrogenase n=1 Tax=Microthyrium microscopicum TaxID=703497 RepID=A0A6A6UP82_9PEZI|nr:mannitol-1-phosphate dehydrogenase [Microthyrium microscopicum]